MTNACILKAHSHLKSGCSSSISLTHHSSSLHSHSHSMILHSHSSYSKRPFTLRGSSNLELSVSERYTSLGWHSHCMSVAKMADRWINRLALLESIPQNNVNERRQYNFDYDQFHEEQFKANKNGFCYILCLLMTPLLAPQTWPEGRYNVVQIRKRTTIERLFGIWMFPCLVPTLRTKPETMLTIIIAAAVLYNFLRRWNEYIEEPADLILP